MYRRMAIKNVKRNWKNYLIYFLTIMLVVMLMYSFLSLAFSHDIVAMTDNMSMLSYAIQGLSLFVAVVSVFMIQHAINFILVRRKKEIAIYFLLGMDERTIISLFLRENFFIGIVAFCIGCFGGIGISFVLMQSVVTIFGYADGIKIGISFQSLVSVFVLFFLMFILGLRNAIRAIKSKTIVTLLYDEIKNEEINPIKKLYPKVCAIVLLEIVGVLFLKKAIAIQSNTAIIMLLLSIVLMLVGIYLFYQILPTVSSRIIKKTKWLYRKTNMFLYGQIYSKCKTSGKMIAITAMLLTVSLVTMFVGLVMGEGYKANIKAEYPFDITVAIDAKIDNFNDIVAYIAKDEEIEDYLEYNLYEEEEIPVEIMRLSDYNKLRTMCNLETVGLGEENYIVHCDTWKYLDTIKNAIKEEPCILVGGKTLQGDASDLYTEPFEQYRMNGSHGYVIVVPDARADKLETHKSRLVVAVKGDGEESLKGNLNRFIRKEWNPGGEIVNQKVTISMSVKGWGIKNSLTGFTVFAVVGLYLSVIFIIFSGALLAFEQLDRIEKSQKHYRILMKLGEDEVECRKLIFKELLWFYLVPLLLPAVVFLVVAMGANLLFGEYILKEGVISHYAVITLSLFALVYGVYFYVTYALYRIIK